MAVPKRKTPRSKTRMRRASSWTLEAPARSLCPNCAAVKLPAHRLRELRLVPRPPDARRRLSPGGVRSDTMRIAVDAMGGDRAPGEIVAGALAAVDQLGVEVLLVGHRGRRAGRAARRQAARRRRAAWPAPRSSRCTTSRASRCAPRRTPRSCAPRRRCVTVAPTPWSAPATRAPRWRARCCASAASAASPAPRSRCRSRCRSRRPHLLVDGGATVDCTPEWLTQFAVHGPRRTPRCASASTEPTVGLLSNGEEAGQGRRPAQADVRPARRATRGSSATSRAVT